MKWMQTILFLIFGTIAYSNNCKITFFDSLPECSAQLIRELNLAPVKSIRISNAIFHLSDVFQYQEYIPAIDGKKRFGVFAYVELDDGRTSLRFFYKSGSHGIFRVAPFVTYYDTVNTEGKPITGITWYSKGIGEGSLSIPGKVQLYLFDKIAQQAFRSDINLKHIVKLVASFEEKTGIDEYAGSAKEFEKYNEHQKHLMAQEVSFVDNFIHDFVYDEREYIYKGELRKDIFPQPNSIRLCDQKNMPNYSTGLIQSLDYSIKHYGEVSGLIYRSYNAEVEYYVIKNRENKIWIAGINFVDNGSPITSYGVRSKALDYDYAQFVMPLWERSKYIHPDYRSEQKIPREEKYQSSWKYLVKINLIRSFYEDQFVDVPPDVN